ncbi:uncharacterized protein F4822DRAFT_233677 [Hypoxylon trugodes]|uniref:uncharacterized protein n=1 Tax=Hypoxylon trugodes TaxID=326681 RepID=UPI00218FE983|nr:uncharacterized protein F4822DRAFT_233677 [Hypoxylon trugodes]KAI1390352.1 hypothetical protein F4822DRAFT_233677 [Hypoxylon trugodes]
MYYKMKIIIVGAGLSGLSTAIALRKFIPTSQSLEVKIYDNINPATGQATEQESSNVATSQLGAGLGLEANGIRVLDNLDPTLKSKVYAAGFPCTHFTWKTAGDWLLGREYVDVLPISRPFLINCLQETLPAGVVIHQKVARVITRQGKKPVVQFEDESPDETADLVIGADGIRSTVRRDLFGEDEKYRPQYAGICAVGGVLDVPLPKHLLDNPTMVFYMGSTGVFGYTGLTQADKNKLLYWSVYETDLPGRGLKLDHDLMIQQIRERHGDWTDPLIRQCLQKANLDNVYPIFVMPDLPYWGRDGCVLVGDAVHALPPRSGQGASQAFEDGEALGLLLSGYLEKGYDTNEAISRSILGLFEIRAGRVQRIRADAMRWKDPKMPMSWLKTCGLYITLFILVRVNRVLSFFRRGESWNVRDAVSKYLKR